MWVAYRFAFPTRGFAQGLLLRSFYKIAASPRLCKAPGTFLEFVTAKKKREQRAATTKSRENAKLSAWVAWDTKRYPATRENAPTRLFALLE
jgi:hypothetical protein